MKTYQDLLKVGESDDARGKFLEEALREFANSSEYALAKVGEAYYAKHNLTIEAYQKLLNTVTGRRVEDIFGANYKLKTLFFRRLVTQQVQYVLGNGLTLTKEKNKEKLGKDFDFKLQQASKRAMASGKAFGFWNLDHLEVFGYADTANDAGFCPLYDEKTAELQAGIRFWHRNIDKHKLTRCTLYEIDGYTEYVKEDNKPFVVKEQKRGYKRVSTSTQATGLEETHDENYTRLPIVPLYANDIHESELVGIRECIDCYDFIKSGLANNIDDSSDFFWVLNNTGGMDDVDLAKFVQRMKTVKAVAVDGDQGVSVEPHTMAIPVEARRTMLELLRKDIYEDFQALDVNTLSASAKTTQEIQASYQAQDNKCADFEYYIIEFVNRILELAGIDDTPTFVWNRVVNMAEQTTMVLQASNYLTPEAVVKHLPFLTPEEADIICKEMNKQSYDMFNAEEEDTEESDEEENIEDN